MASEFHQKMTSLFEDFKKKELHFLNLERKCDSHRNWEINVSAPAQEYLKKINQREREAERSYTNIMKHMDNMEKRTEQMSLNLEKLNVLKNIAMSPSVLPSKDTFVGSYHTFYNSQLFQRPSSSALPMNSIGSYFMQSSETIPALDTTSRELFPDSPFAKDQHLQKTSLDFTLAPKLQSEFTQTEHVYCDNCQHPLTSLHSMPVRPSSFENGANRNAIAGVLNDVTSSDDVAFGNVDNRKEVPSNYSEKFDSFVRNSEKSPERKHSNFVNDSNKNSSEMRSVPLSEINHEVSESHRRDSGKNVHATNTENKSEDEQESYIRNSDLQNSTDRAIGVSSVSDYRDIQNIEMIKDSHHLNSNKDTLASKSTSKERSSDVRKEPYRDSEFQEDSKEEHIRTILHHDSENRQPDEISNDRLSNTENIDRIVSKSDDESMNHEFDFLDSDKTVNRKDSSQTPSDALKENVGPSGSSARARRKSSLRQLGSIATSQGNRFLDVARKDDVDGRSESSISVEPASPALNSELSESDSCSENLTAAAAYQALLGNASVAKTVQRKQTEIESDSEDEIENAVATAVRRSSNIVFDTSMLSQKAEDEKNVIAEEEPNRDARRSISASNKRPQSKLSKSTRKVLGMETSSGSEVELEATTATQKKDEDSDEFDFYD